MFFVNKIAIHTFDIISTVINVKGSTNSLLRIVLNSAEGVHRLIEICRGMYLLKNLTKSKQAPAFQQIILELLNVARLGLSTLNILHDNGLNSPLYGASLGISFVDSAVRIYSLFSHRIAIKKQIFHLAQNKTLTLIGRKLDYPGRVLGSILGLLKSLSVGIGFLMVNAVPDAQQSGLKYPHPDFIHLFKKDFKLLVFTQLISCYYSKIIKTYIDLIFNHFAVQPSANLERAKQAFSIVTSAFISMATAVGVGLHPSIKELISRTFIVTFSVFAGLTAMIATGVGFFQALKNAAGGYVALNRVLQSRAPLVGSLMGLSVVLSAFTTFPIVVGIGLAPTLGDAGLNLSHGVCFILSRAKLNVFWNKLNHLILNGPMNWKDILAELLPFT